VADSIEELGAALRQLQRDFNIPPEVAKVL
jgi:hypothetical protein